MREGGRLRTAAVLSLAGLGQAWLDARWPDEIAVLEALAEEIDEESEHRKDALARAIRNEVSELLPK